MLIVNKGMPCCAYTLGQLAVLEAICTSYCMCARAIRQILASSPRAAGPRASANIMTYSPRTHAITSLLHDEVPIYRTGIVVSAIILYIGIAVPLNL